MNELQAALYRALRALNQGQELEITLSWSEIPFGPRKWVTLHLDKVSWPEMTSGSEEDTFTPL